MSRLTGRNAEPWLERRRADTGMFVDPITGGARHGYGPAMLAEGRRYRSEPRRYLRVWESGTVGDAARAWFIEAAGALVLLDTPGSRVAARVPALRCGRLGYPPKMRLLRHVAREYLIHRLSRGRHRGYGYWRRHPSRHDYRWHRPRQPFIVGRPHRRTRVHVGGCCLPIPLGVLIGSTVMARLLFHRGRR